MFKNKISDGFSCRTKGKEVKFTRIKNNDGLLTKVYTKTEDGYDKNSHAYLQHGKMTPIDVEFKELDAYLDCLEPSEAIILGSCNRKETFVAPSNNLKDGEIARIKANFDFSDEQILLFDIDVAMTPDDAVIALSKLDPRFGTAEMLIRYGTSSYLYDTNSEKYLTESTSLHIYVPCTNIANLDTYIESLCQKSWEVGSAFIKVSSIGSMLERYVFDAAVFSPERLVFEAGAVCHGLEQRKPPSVYRAGSKLELLGLSYDSKKAKVNKDLAKKEKRIESNELKTKFIKNYAEKVKALGGDDKSAQKDVNALLKRNITSGLYLYDLEGNHFFAGSISADMNLKKIQDPIEPNGSQKAIIYWNNGSPTVHSFKSGTFKVELYSSTEKNVQENITLGFEYSPKGKLLPTIKSLKTLLIEHSITYEYDLLKKSPKLMHKDIDWDLPNPEQKSLQIVRDISHRMGMTPQIVDVVEALANDRDYIKNPVMDMVKRGHEKWSQDRKDWIAELVKVLQPQADINKELVTKWLIQCVAAWDFDELSPQNNRQASYENVLVLQGAQGTRKTSFFRKLLPVNLGDYFKEGAMLNPDNKDSVKQCTSYALVELGELEATFNKSDIGSLKAFLSNPYDEYRLPYARKEEKHRRSVSFCGTVNDQQFLRDRSGARRFWLIPVDCIDMDLMDSIPKEELWGQVFDLYVSGEPWYIDTASETYAELEKVHTAFEAYTPAHDVLAHIEKCLSDGIAIERISASKMFKDLGINNTKTDVDALVQKLLDKGVSRYSDRTFRVAWKSPQVM